jgi:hypothetical protein
MASVTCAAALAQASIILDVRADREAQDVVQGGDGRINFTVVALPGMAVTLDSLDPAFGTPVNTTPDQQDAITRIERAGGTCRAGSMITSNSECTYTIRFFTDDPRRPDPNTDYGLWDVTLTAFGHLTNDRTVGGNRVGHSTVYVRDPGAALPTPEPATILPAAFAMAGLIAVGLARARHKKQLVQQ